MIYKYIAMNTLFHNAIYCNLCDDYIQSFTRHDYKTCKCGNASVDGGLSYERYGWREEGSIISFSMCIEDHPFSIIRQYFYRWNFIKEEYVLLKDIDDEWLEAILEFYIPSDLQIATMDYKYLLLFLMEKQYRNAEEE